MPVASSLHNNGSQAGNDTPSARISMGAAGDRIPVGEFHPSRASGQRAPGGSGLGG